MKRIAIVEDNEKDYLNLKENIDLYSKENQLELIVDLFKTSTNFLDNYSFQYDIVFMDIELPDINGLNTAKELRDKDKNIIIIFVTNLASCAIKGYEVNAFDFIVKPVNKYSFSTMFKKALLKRETTLVGDIILKNGHDNIVLNSNSIFYIEVFNHKLTYHTSDGNFEEWGKLLDIENTLKKYHFYRCNSYLLINLKYVKKIEGDYCVVGNEKLPISRNKKKGLVEALVLYISGSEK